jgi:GntR family transcriptional regulator/MocR family aminotransferase
MSDLRFLIEAYAAHDKTAGTQQHQLYAVLRAAMLDGRLQAGTVLPGTRTLAKELGVARNSLIYAYEQLAAEGYVLSNRQGTVVAALGTLQAPLVIASRNEINQGLSARVSQLNRSRTPADDLKPFMPGMPAIDAFPLGKWQRAVERAGRGLLPQELGYRYALGEPELRQAIATYVRAARGVRCHVDQVVVTQGTQDSLTLVSQLLADVGDVAWIEHPGYPGARMAMAQAGLKLVPVTVDADGINPPAHYWQQHRPRMIYTTPSHQYPLGSVLSLARRMALIDQAQSHGAWILEDDYDSEFRHDGPPLAAMQGLRDDAPVVYLGTFSKSLFPALRLGYIVLPQALVDRMAPVLNALVRAGRVRDQRALAEFINEGHFTTHLRRMRKLYAERQAALRSALDAHWSWPVTVLGGQCGMHLTLAGLPVSDARLADMALSQGLSPRALSAYGCGGIDGFEGLVMGYANVPAEDMSRHVQHLVSVVKQLDQIESSKAR